MIQGFIFDMDGTITLTEPLHHKAYSEIFRRYGIEFTLEEEITKYAGSGSKYIFSNVFLERGVEITPEEIEECIDEKKKLYTKIVHESEIPLVDGAKEFIKKIHEKGMKKIIATGNSNLDAVRFMLEKVGVSEYFPQLLSVSEVPRGKPFPDAFIEAAKRLGLPPEQCIVLEDAINGVLAAKAAGMKSIALETTTEREDLVNAGATYVVKNYFEITPHMYA